MMIYDAKSSLEVLSEFMRCWRSQRLLRLKDYTQKSHKDSCNEVYLRTCFDNTLLSYSIVTREDVSDMCHKYALHVTVVNNGLISLKELTVVLIKESSSCVPSPNGYWGVSPASITNFKLILRGESDVSI